MGFGATFGVEFCQRLDLVAVAKSVAEDAAVVGEPGGVGLGGFHQELAGAAVRYHLPIAITEGGLRLDHASDAGQEVTSTGSNPIEDKDIPIVNEDEPTSDLAEGAPDFLK